MTHEIFTYDIPSDSYLECTGFVTDVEFIYPSTTLIRFDNRDTLVFDDYTFHIPRYRKITFEYHEGYNFDNKNRIYVLDNFTIHES